MRSSKNSVAVLLIVSSILLLLALQALWLKNSYEKAYHDLRKQTSDILRNTVFALRDSMLLKNIERIPDDTAHNKKQIRFTNKTDTIISTNGESHGLNASQVRVFISSDNKADSLKKIVQPIVTQIHEGKLLNGGTFIVRMNMDSLSLDSIEYYYKKSIHTAGLDLSVKINHSTDLPPAMGIPRKNILREPPEEREEEPTKETPFSDKMNSTWVRVDPINRYHAVLSDFKPILIRQISPQILFSFFLTLLTSASFIIMYRSIRSQQRLMELKNDFISNITHELKTPITTVGVAIEAMKDFNAIENPILTKEYLDIAKNELTRLSILTDKILKTSIFENNGIDFKPEPVQMDKLIEEVITSLKLVIEKQKANVSFEKTGDDFSLLGGRIHLTSVIYNLLDNALKYSIDHPIIEMKLKAETTLLTLSVKDHGIGISAEYRKKVFEKFFRVPTGDVHNIKGHGLGLSYVESVVKSHNGTIEVQSEPGVGSNFIVSLPR